MSGKTWVGVVLGMGCLCGLLFAVPADARSSVSEPQRNDGSVVRTPNGDEKTDLLNEAQLGSAYKGPVYYKGQAIPPAQPVQLETSSSAAPKEAAPPSRSLAAPEARTAPVSAYHGSLYYPPNSSSLPAPSPN